MSMRMARADAQSLERRLDQQAELLASLAAELAELRSLLGRSQTEIVRRLQELHVAQEQRPVPPARAAWPPEPAAVPAAAPAAATEPRRGPTMSPDEYARLVTRVRALVRTVVPAGAVVAVVSRGDDALLRLDGRIGWHFPRLDDGRYVGHHPRDGEAAIAQLEELRRRGARYLVFPATALWWLDHYDALRAHLDERHRLVLDREDACLIYDLDTREPR